MVLGLASRQYCDSAVRLSLRMEAICFRRVVQHVCGSTLNRKLETPDLLSVSVPLTPKNKSSKRELRQSQHESLKTRTLTP